MAVLAVLAAAVLAAGATQTVAYRLAPHLHDGRLKSVGVAMDFSADASGRTTVELPDHYAGQTNLQRAIAHLAVTGGSLRMIGATKAVVRSAPRAMLNLCESALAATVQRGAE